MSVEVRWSCPPYRVAAADAVASAVGVSPITAAVLVRRGYETPEAARRFLAADERHDPFALPGMAAACDRILAHVERGSRIVVHGDYDVDGVCSTAILVRTLRALGAAPAWHLPSRFDGGYGLSVETVARLADGGADLLVTADCGVTCAAEVDAAAARGVEVVVSDHHRPGETLPACPTVHPGLGGYPFPDLCAAGVAHKLAAGLLTTAELDPADAEEDLDLVALATVADLVPLRGENRRLVREGLRELRRTRKPGLRALMQVARVDPGALDAHAAGFRLAPRLNAAGRLGRADAALELLLTEDSDRAGEVADELDLLNARRRGTEARILAAAESARAEHPDAPAYVLAGEDWHAGVIGIVASRLVERHHRPCVLVALDGGGGRGSGRSVPAYDLHAGFAACAPHLRRFGGHRAAAGLEIDADRVEAFRRDFIAHAGASLSAADLRPVEAVDAVAPGGALGLGLAEELERLGPFGQGNPAPTLLVPAARIADVRAMGEDREHASLTLATGATRARAVAFGTSAGRLSALGDEPHDVAARLEANEWNGAVEPRLVVRALRPTGTGTCRALADPRPFWEVVEQELEAALDGAAPAPAPSPPAAVSVPPRAVRDRRGEGFAGVAGELVSSGEPVLVACADAARRRAGIDLVLGDLGRALAGGRPGGQEDPCAPDDRPGLALVSWEVLAATPKLAEPFAHLIALDPPRLPFEERLLAAAPAASRPGFSHLAWGAPEVDFTLRVSEAELDLRAELRDLYGRLRSAGEVAGPDLEALLRGGGAHPRAAWACGRLLRVLLELGVIKLSRAQAGAAP
ncbi:MAG: single-stranded-DNA-specific exonuclease RecJ, partial [Actinomycetota bacterium]|nr:single-stranded-DNA-specific exonuclease RecJ [Actinomycetota bacterium]